MINFSKLAALAKATPKELAQSTSADALAQEKLTRRAALRRIGMTGAMTVIGVMSIDDLARVSAKKLEQNELTRGIAQDFKNAGIAFATPSVQSICNMGCDNQHITDMAACGPAPAAWDIIGQVIWGVCRGQADSDRKTCHGSCTQFGTD